MKTIIDQFQDAVLKEHREPEREGVAKGDPIGFSRAKKAAALWVAITQKEKKQIAKELEISYSVLRKWETEPTFRALMHRYAGDFGTFAVEQLEQREIETGEWIDALSPAAQYSLRLALKQKLEKGTLSEEKIERILSGLFKLPAARNQESKWITNREPNKSYVANELHLMRHAGERPTDDPIGDIISELRTRLYRSVQSYLELREADEAVEKAKRALQTLQETEQRRAQRKEAA